MNQLFVLKLEVKTMLLFSSNTNENKRFLTSKEGGMWENS